MIAIGSDHGGYGLKQEIMAHLKEQDNRMIFHHNIHNPYTLHPVPLNEP